MRRASRLPALAFAALFAMASGIPGLAHAAPADDLKEAQRLYNRGLLGEALAKVDVMLNANPRDPQARFLRGLVLHDQKRTADAIQAFTALTEDYPELPEPYNNLAVIYAAQGNYERAKAVLELAIRTHPGYAMAHENLGDIYTQLAKRSYDRALQLDKNNASAQSKSAKAREIVAPQRAAQ